MQENDKLLIAYDYFENDRFLSSSDDKQKDIVEKIRRTNQDIVVINDELEQLKRVIQKIQSGASNNERDLKLKQDINILDNQILEKTLERDRLSADQKKFVDIKKTL